MIKFVRFIYGSEKFELALDVPVERAVERVNSELRRRETLPLPSEGMIGYADKHGVKIGRIMPIMKNTFKPFYFGEFLSGGERAILSGNFRMPRYVQVGVTFWFGFVAWWVLNASISALKKPIEYWYFPLSGVFVLCLGVGLLKLGQSMSKDDIRFIKKALNSAINQNS